MQRSVKANPSLQSKVEQIRSGVTRKSDLGVKENKGVIQSKGGKFIIEEKEKKFEEAGVKRKKRNYVLYESKLGTEKEQNLTKIEEPLKPKPKSKPKPKQVPVARERNEEKIIQTKKRKEYLDNYQYLETKVIRKPNPNRVSIVTHQRLCDIIGGFYEEKTFQKQSIRQSANAPTKFSQQTTKTITRGGPQGQTQKTITTSRTMPAQSREYRREVAQKNKAPALRGTKTTTTTTTTTKTTNTRSNSRPQNPRGTNSTTTTTTTRKVVTRGQSAGRRH